MKRDAPEKNFNEFNRDNLPTLIPLPANDFEGLKELIQQATNEAVETYNEGRAKLYFRGQKHSELCLRSERVPVQTLVIVRIVVEPRHQGIGTQILEWLKKYATEKGFNRIVIENANTEDSVGFAKRRGFSKCDNPSLELFGLEDEDMFCNYELLLDMKN